MKKICLLMLICLVLSNGYSQTIEQASAFYEKDSLDQASKILSELDQNDKKVKKLQRKIKKREKQVFYDLEVKNSANVRIYGGVPTANENLKWEENLTSNEKYTGVIYVDSAIGANKIVEAFIATFQPIQDANLMTKQMRTNSMIGTVSSSLGGDYRSAQDFAEFGDADSRMQNSSKTVWTVQFIDGVRMFRFYYNIRIHAKDGRYKITIIPSGTSGYAQDHIQTEWSRLFNNDVVKPIHSNYHAQMKIKLAYTIDQWTKEVAKYLDENESDDW